MGDKGIDDDYVEEDLLLIDEDKEEMMENNGHSTEKDVNRTMCQEKESELDLVMQVVRKLPQPFPLEVLQKSPKSPTLTDGALSVLLKSSPSIRAFHSGEIEWFAVKSDDVKIEDPEGTSEVKTADGDELEVELVERLICVIRFFGGRASVTDLQNTFLAMYKQNISTHEIITAVLAKGAKYRFIWRDEKSFVCNRNLHESQQKKGYRFKLAIRTCGGKSSVSNVLRAYEELFGEKIGVDEWMKALFGCSSLKEIRQLFREKIHVEKTPKDGIILTSNSSIPRLEIEEGRRRLVEIIEKTQPEGRISFAELSKKYEEQHGVELNKEELWKYFEVFRATGLRSLLEDTKIRMEGTTDEELHFGWDMGNESAKDTKKCSEKRSSKKRANVDDSDEFAPQKRGKRVEEAKKTKQLTPSQDAKEANNNTEKQSVGEGSDVDLFENSEARRQEGYEDGNKGAQRKSELVVCEHCGKEYDKNRHELHLMKEHGVEKPYKCDKCPAVFSKASYKLRHQTIHTPSRLLQCDQCEKTFADKSNFNRHVKVVHEEIKQHECTVCGKGFSEPFWLKEHIRMHSGERPFECRQCGKTFARKKALKQHRMSHEPWEGILGMEEERTSDVREENEEHKRDDEKSNAEMESDETTAEERNEKVVDRSLSTEGRAVEDVNELREHLAENKKKDEGLTEDDRNTPKRRPRTLMKEAKDVKKAPSAKRITGTSSAGKKKMDSAGEEGDSDKEKGRAKPGRRREGTSRG